MRYAFIVGEIQLQVPTPFVYLEFNHLFLFQGI